MDLNRKSDETDFAWKLRLIRAKFSDDINISWEDMVKLLGEEVTPDQFRKVARGIMEYDNYLNNNDSVATKILSVSDTHVPFQLDYHVLEDYRNVDILQLNGDIVDCQALSKYSKQYRISPMEEMIQGRQYLIDMIEYIHPRKVIATYGNHDKRFANYFAKNIDTDILELLPDTSLELVLEDGFRHYDKRSKSKIWYEPLSDVFDDIEIEYADDWKVKIGKTWFVHPLAYRSGILSTAQKSKEYLQDKDTEIFDCVVLAHTHAVGDSESGNIRLLEQGAFADVEQMNYMDGRLTRPQKEGFAVICQDINGNIIKDKSKVVCLN